MCSANHLEACIKSTTVIDSDNKAISQIITELTLPYSDEREKAQRLFYYVRDQIHYSVYMISTKLEDFIASTVLQRGKGYCVQKAVLLVALARAAGIPSRLVFAKIRNHKAPRELTEQTGYDYFPSHGYTQLFLQKQWVNLTPAFDKELCEKTNVPVVEFDGIHDASLPQYDLSGKPYISYLEKYEPQMDLPFEWLRGRILPIWGEKHAWLTHEDSRGHVMPSGYVFR